MIDYETNNSPFFEANKKFCEAIENQLKSFKYEYSGFCNSYGYEIESHFVKNNLSYHLKFIKYQITRNGRFIPLDAVDFTGLELKIHGLDTAIAITFGKSKLMRLLSSKEMIKHIPSPFYLSTKHKTNHQNCTKLANLLLVHKVDSLKLKKGNAFLKFNSAKNDAFEIISELETAILKCK
jgi:hypothetical protein